jgi:hypothetical protein
MNYEQTVGLILSLLVGFSIASVLVSVLAVAVLMWLRARDKKDA